MNTIAYVLATRELFVPGPAAGPEAAAAEPRVLRELRHLGWPAEATLRGPGAPASGPVPGVLVELIDALPLLAAATEEEGETADLLAYRQAARLALELAAAGAALPRLRARTSGGVQRGWEARWRTTVLTAAQRARVVRLGELMPPITAVLVGAAFTGPALTGQRLLYRLLDACVDMLVREASRRGAMVRLGRWPAGAWEQQLVRALGEERATFRCSDPEAAAAIAKEVNDWVGDQLDAASLSLLPSPVLWTAPESLTQVVTRLLGPAAQLALTLRSGRPAPRMLPTTTWLPRKAAAAAATAAAGEARQAAA